VGRASAVLGDRRLLPGVALLTALIAYYALFRYFPNLPTAWDVLFVAFLLIPAVFALMWAALPLRHARGLLPVGVGFAVLAVVASTADLDVVANFAKLFAATAVAFWFLSFFENALWVALVAMLIPFVDAYSVWRGPTRHIIDERPEVFGALSFSFPLMGERQAFVVWGEPLAGPTTYDVLREPGGTRNDEPLRDRDRDGEVGWLEAELDAREDYRYRVVAHYPESNVTSPEVPSHWRDTNEGESLQVTTTDRRSPTDLRVESVDSAAKLGLPDLLFFALFLAAADQFRLRLRATWLLMALSFGLTLAGTYFLSVDGLPALPLLAIAFLLANADLLWRQWRNRKGGERTQGETTGPARRESAGGAPPP
jgi:hypothetical protein